MFKRILVAAAFFMSAAGAAAAVNTIPPEVDLASGPKMTVIIDPAHGGGDYGSSGRGIYEKDITLKAAKILKQKLEKASADISVFLTRDADSAVKPEDRAGFANSRNGTVYISLHCDYAPSEKTEGFEVYYYSGEALSGPAAAAEWEKVQLYHLNDSVRLAGLVNQYMLSPLIAQQGAAGQEANDTVPLASRGVKPAALLSLIGVNMPAVAIELGNLNNVSDAGYLKDDKMLGKIAYHIEEAIVNFLKSRSAQQQ
ncbi:MAG: N-acetylmuramoyl-L-alanine amidase [Candidatus Goldiibacteriota bacterium]|jgi:N-acetylmuramoyl-L-alanine amidase